MLSVLHERQTIFQSSFVELTMPRLSSRSATMRPQSLDECELLVLCSLCVDTAARVVRLWTAAGDDPRPLQRLTTAKEAAPLRGCPGAQIELERIRQQQRDARPVERASWGSQALGAIPTDR